MFGVLCNSTFADEIKEVIASNNDSILIYVCQENIDIVRELEKASLIFLSHLIIDISAVPDKELLINALRRYRIINSNTQIIIIAPDTYPPNKTISELVAMGIYDILTPRSVQGSQYLIDNLAEVINRPSSYQKAVKWVLNNNQDSNVKEIEIIKKIYETPYDYKKKIGFVGHQMAGTTSLICWIADYLGKNKIKTAILDLTKNRDLYEIYPFNEGNIEGQDVQNSLGFLAKGEILPYEVRKNIHLFTAAHNEVIRIDNYIKLLLLLESEYDVILLDMDYQTPLDLINFLNTLFIVQTLDTKKLKFNTAFQLSLKEQHINLKKVKYIINQVIPSDVKPKKIYECLQVHTNLKTLEQTVIMNSDVTYYEVP